MGNNPALVEEEKDEGPFLEEEEGGRVRVLSCGLEGYEREEEKWGM